MGSYREHIEAGWLMAYGFDILALFVRVAEHVHGSADPGVSYGSHTDARSIAPMLLASPARRP